VALERYPTANDELAVALFCRPAVNDPSLPLDVLHLPRATEFCPLATLRHPPEIELVQLDVLQDPPIIDEYVPEDIFDNPAVILE
jgi:hypothetical protein